MSLVWRWLKRLFAAIIILFVILLSPVGYVELACRGEVVADEYLSLITDPKWQRAESQTLMTYPEWHIVHAYDDYAKVIATGDPHDFDYFRAISGFWQALCPLSRQAASMGGVTSESKLTIYTIGVSFTAELFAKAAYEESIGRFATVIRGARRATLDNISAKQAAEYAQFLQQTPWYEWDFVSDVKTLNENATSGFRDQERALALGFEFGAKSAYAGAIAKAVESVGKDQLRLRSWVSGISADELRLLPTVMVLQETSNGILIETGRYRAFTKLLMSLAVKGADLIEVASNDEILFTAVSDERRSDVLFSFQRQGYGDWRNLIVVPVPELLNRMRALGDLRLEHVHDY